MSGLSSTSARACSGHPDPGLLTPEHNTPHANGKPFLGHAPTLGAAGKPSQRTAGAGRMTRARESCEKKLAIRASSLYDWRMLMRKYTGGELSCNGYLLPGMNGEYVAVDAPTGFAKWVQSQLPAGARLAHLLLTHQHFDHIADAAALQAATGCAIHACRPYTPALTLCMHARQWSIPLPPAFQVDDTLGDQDSTATWAGWRWQLLHVPGHSIDSMVYYLPDADLLFAGDVLFAGSIGRTDLAGGSHAQLTAGIRRKLLTLPPATDVYPGHGPATSVQEEEINNPHL